VHSHDFHGVCQVATTLLVLRSMEHEQGKKLGGLGFVLLVYAASRLFYLVAGALLATFVPVSRFKPSAIVGVPLGPLNIWAHFDGAWYSLIAKHGYGLTGSPAFFPLYPLLMRSLAELFGGPLTLGALSVWGVLLSLLAFPFALYFIYRIVEEGWGSRVAKVTVLILALFPTSFFFNAAYTESLFLALSAGSLWALRVRSDLLLACLLAGLATATRNVGVFLLVPLAYEYLRNAREYRWRGAYLLLAPSGLAVYAAYLWWRFGDPLLFYTEQRHWGRTTGDHLSNLLGAWKPALRGARMLLDPSLLADPSLGRLAGQVQSGNNAYYLAIFLFAVALLVAGLRLLPSSLSVYALLLVLLPAFFGPPESPLFSFPRFMLVAFPLFITLAVVLENHRWLLRVWLGLSATFSLVLCALFVSWRFVA
jgi:hypothetical protein